MTSQLQKKKLMVDRSDDDIDGKNFKNGSGGDIDDGSYCDIGVSIDNDHQKYDGKCQ